MMYRVLSDYHSAFVHYCTKNKTIYSAVSDLGGSFFTYMFPSKSKVLLIDSLLDAPWDLGYKDILY